MNFHHFRKIIVNYFVRFPVKVEALLVLALSSEASVNEILLWNDSE